MRKINFPLLLGSIIVIFLIFVTLYPGLFTKNDPLFEEPNKYIEYKVDGKWVEEIGHNPMRPSRENILGTDDAGRDVYARLIYGTRNTLKLALLIAIFRMLLALSLGMAAGMGVKLVSGIIKVFNTFFTAIPMLLFSFLVLNIGYFKNLQMDKAIIAFAIVLTIVGWAKLAGIIEDLTRRIMEEDFIEGEIATGKTRLQIAYQNVLPHIIPDSISLFFKEMGMALFLIAQLAVLYVFVGVTRRVKELAFRAAYGMILEPEWGGALSRIAVNVKRYESVYWMTLYPVLVFTFAIVGINLMGEGLRIEFQKRESRVISTVKKASYLISPRIFFSQLKNIKKYYKPVIIKALTITVIISYIIIPWNPSLYEFNLNNAKLHLDELIKDKYDGRAAGSEGGYLAGEYIIQTMESYGYEVDTMDIPFKLINQETYKDLNTQRNNGNFNFSYVLAPTVIESGWIKITDTNGEEKTYYLHKDFEIPSININILKNNLDMPKDDFHYKGIVTDTKNASNVPEGEEFFIIKEKFWGFSNNDFFYNSQINVESKGKINSELQFILGEGDHKGTNTYLYKYTSIMPFGALRAEIIKGYSEVEICFGYPNTANHNGRNITAFLPGKNKTKEDPGELIIIGASYDGVKHNEEQNPYAMTAAPAATAMEVARVLSQTKKPLEKSIQFIFWDNEFEGLKYSNIDGSYYYSLEQKIPIEMANSHKYYYFDISYPGFIGDKKLNFVTYPAQRAKSSNYLMDLEIEKRLKKMNVKFERFHYDYTTTKAANYMRLNALGSVGIGNPSTYGINGKGDNKENINYKMMKNIGQVIVDTMTMNPYIMK